MTRVCDACRVSFELERVCHAPVLFDASWAKLAKPNENLCVECFDARANQRGIRITLANLKPCPFNCFAGFFEIYAENAPPDLIKDWLQWAREGQRAMEERQNALVEKYHRPGNTAHDRCAARR